MLDRFLKIIIIITILLLQFLFIINEKTNSFLLISVLLFISFFIYKKDYFWKFSFIIFSILTIIFSYKIFGGLEPNSNGIQGTENWFEFLIFFTLTSSSLASLVLAKH